MSDALLRLLDLIRRELDAADAHAEFGGRDPEDPRVIFHGLGRGWRLVVRFDEEISNRDELTERLSKFAIAFSGIDQAAPRVHRSPEQLVAHRLNETLADLAAGQAAIRALVIDGTSPVIWGTSHPQMRVADVTTAERVASLQQRAQSLGLDLASLLAASGDQTAGLLRDGDVDPNESGAIEVELTRIRNGVGASDVSWPNYVRTCLALRAVRSNPESKGSNSLPARLSGHSHGAHFMARSFAQMYWLILVFESTFSELHAETAMVRALPIIERFVLELPPSDPQPPGAKLMRLKPLRSV